MTDKNRFEKLLEKHYADLAERGHSSWMEVGYEIKDGVKTVSVLRNPMTGEVVSNEGW